MPIGPVNPLAYVFSDRHVLNSGMLQDVELPATGSLKMLTSPILLDGKRLQIRCPPPTLGQHTEEGW